jgi:hypothetical protein
MKNWKLAYKIMGVYSGFVFFIGILCGAANGPSDFALILGIVCLIGGLIGLAVGFIVFITGSREWGKGLLLSAGVLFLLSGISCGAGLSNIDFH